MRQGHSKFTKKDVTSGIRTGSTFHQPDTLLRNFSLPSFPRVFPTLSIFLLHYSMWYKLLPSQLCCMWGLYLDEAPSSSLTHHWSTSFSTCLHVISAIGNQMPCMLRFIALTIRVYREPLSTPKMFIWLVTPSSHSSKPVMGPDEQAAMKSCWVAESETEERPCWARLKPAPFRLCVHGHSGTVWGAGLRHHSPSQYLSRSS